MSAPFVEMSASSLRPRCRVIAWYLEGEGDLVKAPVEGGFRASFRSWRAQ